MQAHDDHPRQPRTWVRFSAYAAGHASHGEIIADGSPEAVRNDPAVLEAYLGIAMQLEVSGVSAG